MHRATDDLAGTDVYGTSSQDPMGNSEFSVNFETAVPGWDEMLLTTGDCVHWMVMSKDAAIGSYYGDALREVKKSHTSSTPYNINAERNAGNNEQPWLQYTEHHDQGTALYVEGDYNANGGNGEGSKYSGLNVYIRTQAEPPSSEYKELTRETPEPNGGVKSDCATLNAVSGKWNDVSCNDENYFVCETKRW
jgi:hypothetical protein